MKTIRIWANSGSTGIFDELGNFIFQENTTVKNKTWKDLQKWVREYEPYTSLSSSKIVEKKVEIKELDKKGIELMRRIQKEWKYDINTKKELQFLYYSELLGKYLV